mmetsp:Transcript_12727/g.21589  ORF Transcript_12727/g.21589 Transcript_12727/m.21589 type:complete len:218 (-) Transcript_12727:68-721(-)
MQGDRAHIAGCIFHGCGFQPRRQTVSMQCGIPRHFDASVQHAAIFYVRARSYPALSVGIRRERAAAHAGGQRGRHRRLPVAIPQQGRDHGACQRVRHQDTQREVHEHPRRARSLPCVPPVGVRETYTEYFFRAFGKPKRGLEAASAVAEGTPATSGSELRRRTSGRVRCDPPRRRAKSGFSGRAITQGPLRAIPSRLHQLRVRTAEELQNSCDTCRS